MAELRDVEGDGISSWALVREYRSTYREELDESEELVAGTWTGRADPAAGPAPISLDQGIAESLAVSLGDRLVWDVQGAEIETVVGSIRAVEWLQLRPNFFAVFPAGVLEEAPQFHVVLARAPGVQRIGALQRALVQRFPNVSVIDTALVMQLAGDLLARAGAAIHFLAMFAIVAGLVVLVSSVLASRLQRLEEAVLLRTLGATRRQIVRIVNAEYLFLGALAALTGLLLSLGATWALATWRFHTRFVVAPGPLLLAGAGIVLLTVLLGRIGSRGLLARPPLEALRAEC